MEITRGVGVEEAVEMIRRVGVENAYLDCISAANNSFICFTGKKVTHTQYTLVQELIKKILVFFVNI